MRYVMVPVPSQFVMDVLRLVVFRAPDEDTTGIGDAARLQQLLVNSDDLARELVQILARATLGDEQVRFSEAADQLNASPEVLAELVRDVNLHALGGSRELIGVSDEIAVRVHGDVGRNRYLVMRPEHARMIRALRADPGAAPG